MAGMHVSWKIEKNKPSKTGMTSFARCSLILISLLKLSVTGAHAQSPSPSPAAKDAPKKPAEYINAGDNMKGFSGRYGNPTVKSDGKTLNAFPGGGWYALPLRASGNFKIEFDVFNDSNDGDSHLLLVDDATNAGIDVRNSPQATDTPSINIFYAKNLATHNDFYFLNHHPRHQRTPLAFPEPHMDPCHHHQGRQQTHRQLRRPRVISADIGKIFFPRVCASASGITPRITAGRQRDDATPEHPHHRNP